MQLPVLPLFNLPHNKSRNCFLPSSLLAQNQGVWFCKQISQLTIHCSNRHTHLFLGLEVSLESCCQRKVFSSCEIHSDYLQIYTNYLQARGIFEIRVYTVPCFYVYIAR